jgi:1-aminocyclopropane-1-carboxylate deaminase
MPLPKSVTTLIADENVVVEPLRHPVFLQAGVDVSIARLDQIDETVSGNKWFKLKYNIKEAVNLGAKGLLTFGGPYSNHLHAVAAVGNRLELATVGILRGELHEVPTPTLQDCLAWGMSLHPVTRAKYKLRSDESYRQRLRAEFPGYYLVPEGGTNSFAVRGVSELVAKLLSQHGRYDIVACPVGSGGTLAGCIEGVGFYASRDTERHLLQKSWGCQVLGFSALKSAKDALKLHVSQLLSSTSNVSWDICEDYHFGGFGKFPRELLAFMEEFESFTELFLDPVYTSKMMYGLVDQALRGEFAAGSRLLVLHTGGLQGRRGH